MSMRKLWERSVDNIVLRNHAAVLRRLGREERAAQAAEKRYAEACSVICIDPGKRIGYAGITNGRIVCHGTVGNLDELPPADFALIEEPVIYPDPAKQKGDPNIIRKLYGLALLIGEQYPAYALVTPKEWNFGKPKQVVTNCVRQSLLPGETEGRSQHARDAQGMAFWLLKRALWCKSR